jgi:hypothetical protein
MASETGPTRIRPSERGLPRAAPRRDRREPPFPELPDHAREEDAPPAPRPPASGPPDPDHRIDVTV